MKAVIKIREKIHTLKLGNYLIGHNCDFSKQEQYITIDDLSVDKKHAILIISEIRIELIDLCSKNGTFVEGEKIGNLFGIPLEKSTQLKFGDVVCQFEIIENDHDNLLDDSAPLSSQQDLSEIIPGSPESIESQLCRVKIRKKPHKSISCTPLNLNGDSSFMIPSTQLTLNNDIGFKNNISDEIQQSISALQADDDFLVPETQEVINKESEVFVQISTQDFNCFDENSNNSDNILANFDMSEIRSPIIPLINSNFNKNQSMRNSDKTNDDDDVTDCEDELMLKWDESNISNLKQKELSVKSGSATPDIEFDKVQTTKPFLNTNLISEVSTIQKTENSEKIKPVGLNSSSSNNIITSTSVSDELDKTQIFHVKDGKSIQSIICDQDSIKKNQDEINFLKPTNVYDVDYIMPTQLFVQPKNVQNKFDMNIPTVSSPYIDEDDLPPTQIFHFKPSESISREVSPCILESDGDDTLFCMQETLEIGKEPTNNIADKKELNENQNITKTSSNIQEKNKTKKINKLFGSSDEDQESDNRNLSKKLRKDLKKSTNLNQTHEIIRKNIDTTPTLDFDFDILTPDFIKLPDIAKVKAADLPFQRICRERKKKKILLEESSDEENSRDELLIKKNIKPNMIIKLKKCVPIKKKSELMESNIKESNIKKVDERTTSSKTSNVKKVLNILKSDDSHQTEDNNRRSSRIKTLPSHLTDFDSNTVKKPDLEINKKKTATKNLVAKNCGPETENAKTENKSHESHRKKPKLTVTILPDKMKSIKLNSDDSNITGDASIETRKSSRKKQVSGTRAQTKPYEETIKKVEKRRKRL